MKIRGTQIVVVVLAIMIGFIILALSRTGGETVSGGAPQKDVSPGYLPPVGATADSFPVIEVSNTDYDLGVIANNQLAKGSVEIFNRGKAPLVVSEVRTSCGCTTGHVENKTISPGGKEPLLITVDPYRIAGFESTKTLTIFSSDVKHPTVEVKVSAHIEPEYALTPKEVNFGEIRKGESKKATVTLRQLADEPLIVSKIETVGSKDGLLMSLEKLPEDKWTTPGKVEYLITAEITPAISAGTFNGSATVSTSLTRIKTLRIPIKAQVKSFYSLSANVLRFTRSEPGKQGALTLTVLGEKPIEIKELAVSGKDLEFVALPGSGANEMTLSLNISPIATAGVKKETLTFTVTAPGEEAKKETVSVMGVVYVRPPQGSTPAQPPVASPS